MPSDASSVGLPPEHLVVWRQGIGPRAVAPLLADDELGPDFLLEDWVAGVRDGDAGAAIAVVSGGRAPVAPATGWRRHLDDVVACLRGETGGFTGDTTPTSLARLRTWTRAAVSGPDRTDGPAVDDLVLVVDELASNVERHAPGWLTVDLVVRPDSVTVAVTDPRPWALPAAGERSDPVGSGRGLLLVAELSSDWGVLIGRTSKSVWATVPR